MADAKDLKIIPQIPDFGQRNPFYTPIFQSHDITSRYEEKKVRVEERKYLEGCSPPQEPSADNYEFHIA